MCGCVFNVQFHRDKRNVGLGSESKFRPKSLVRREAATWFSTTWSSWTVRLKISHQILDIYWEEGELQGKNVVSVSAAPSVFTICKHFPIRQHPPVEEVWLHKLCHWLKGLYSNPLSFLRHAPSIFFQPSDDQFWEAGIISAHAIAHMTPPQVPQHCT